MSQTDNANTINTNINTSNDFVVINTNEVSKEENKPPSTAEIRRTALNNAVAAYDPTNKIYSAYLGESGTASTLSQSTIEELGEGAQDDLEKIQKINNIIRKYTNIDDILGMVVQSIYSNINTEIKLSYKNFGEQRNKLKTLKKAKALIDDFNIQVNIEKFIRDAITTTYMEGNYLCLLRNDDTNWSISKLSLGIAQQSGFVEMDNPIILIDIKALRDVVRGNTQFKNKKRENLFFKDYQEEIRATYNDDVATAYKDNESYMRLNTDYTGTIRVNAYGRRYGLSPCFRALFPILMLQNFNTADEAMAQARAKKIIHQVMRADDNASGDEAFEQQNWNHLNFVKAFSQSTVVITTNPSVERIEYIEAKVDEINVEKVNLYRNKALSSLGVAFLANDKSQGVGVATISLDQLMRTINSIAESVVKVIENFYRTLLTVNGIGLEYQPSVEISKSEMLNMDLRLQLSKYLYTTLNGSLETSLSLVDIDLEDERLKREQENADNLESVFTPRATAYTTSGNTDNEGGREPDTNPNDPDKQIEDNLYNKTRN